MICILKGKTLQLLFMPWHYAKQHYSQDFLSDSSRKTVFSDEFIDQDSVIIRYSVDPNTFLSLLETATNRETENIYFAELLQPLQKYSPNQYKLLNDQLTKDSALKKTVGVFQIEQLYYFSDLAFDVDISAISLAKVRKCIAKICRESGVKPGEYHGQEATKVIRTMQRSIVQVFENYISSLEKFHLHNLALGYYATQENGVILNKKRYVSFADFDEEIQLELKQKTSSP